MSRSRFIVTGLPRSRTSWCSAFLTNGTTYCAHDASRLGPNFFEQVEKSLGPEVTHVGNSDSGLPLVMDAPPADCKVVAIFRDRTCAEQSFYNYFCDWPYPQFGPPDRNTVTVVFHQAAKRLHRFLDRVKCGMLFPLDYHELNSASRVEAMCNFLGVQFCSARYELFNNLRVNPASEKVRV